MIKTLKNIVLTSATLGALSLGINAYNKTLEEYNGMIGNEQVRLYRDFLFRDIKVLEVLKENGAKIRYIDNLIDPNIINSVYITENGQTVAYHNDARSIEALKEAQNQFNDYLGKIKVKKLKESN